MGMKAQSAKFWESLRSSFWFVPTIMVIGATILATLLLYIDTAYVSTVPSSWTYVYTGGADGARSMLSTVAGSAIGVAGTTFSITIAALTLASSQFGPRLLTNFVRDRGNQIVLGTYIATFTYCLLVLRTIRNATNNAQVDDSVVPHISVTVGVLLALADLGVLIYFIHHIALTIQVSHIIASIGNDIVDGIERLFPEKIGVDAVAFDDDLASRRFEDWFEDEAYPVKAHEGGYVQYVDSDAVLELAREHDVIIRLLHRPGDYVIGGSELAYVYPASRAADDMEDSLNMAFAIGSERTKQQDIQFSIDQLVEVAVRALSPGINDPFTAITCVNELGEALCRLAERELPSSYRYDDERQLRVVTGALTFRNMVDVSFDKLRNYARDSTAVTLRMMEVIAIIMKRTHTRSQREVLLRQADMLLRGSEQGLPEENDRAEVAARYQDVLRIVNRKIVSEQQNGSVPRHADRA